MKKCNPNSQDKYFIKQIIFTISIIAIKFDIKQKSGTYNKIFKYIIYSNYFNII